MKNLNKIILFVISAQLIFSAISIGQKINLITKIRDSTKVQSSKIPSLPILYFIDQNNNDIYESLQLKEEPIPFIGYKAFIRKLISTIRYPTLAKESGIEGNVILEIFVDELGNIAKVNINQSVSKECDQEARKRYIDEAINGYAQLIIDPKPVKYKMPFPIKFKLN
ncbi:MAG: TonB family protein [Saprospiraceae bacterium]|nr:TonB family protein [Saprospiraceae bacterium]